MNPLQCNNPKTKEPKLEAALRIVPEWAEYDFEIQQLISRNRGGKENVIQPSHKGEALKCF